MKRTPLQYRFTSPAGMRRLASCNASNGDVGEQHRSCSDKFTSHADTASVTDFPHPVSPQNRHQFNCIAALDERLSTPYIGEKYWRSALIRPIKNATECCDEGNAIGAVRRDQANLTGFDAVAIPVRDVWPGLSQAALTLPPVESLQPSDRRCENGMTLAIAAWPTFSTSPNNDSVNMTRAHNNKDSV